MARHVRIAAWNCAGAFQKKTAPLTALGPDITVLSEVAEPEKLASRGGSLPDGALWTGSNPNKGLAVLPAPGWSLRADPAHDPALRHILPVHVDGPVPFRLLAVWAQNANDGHWKKGDPGPLGRALERYAGFLSGGPSVVTGDFNNNVIWDRPGWPISHSVHVARLAELGLVSAWHHATGETQGHESRPTHYWRDRREDGPVYHIDYLFLSRDLLDRLVRVEIGGFAEWCTRGLSDHAPIWVDLSR